MLLRKILLGKLSGFSWPSHNMGEVTESDHLHHIQQWAVPRHMVSSHISELGFEFLRCLVKGAIDNISDILSHAKWFIFHGKMYSMCALNIMGTYNVPIICCKMYTLSIIRTIFCICSGAYNGNEWSQSQYRLNNRNYQCCNNHAARALLPCACFNMLSLAIWELGCYIQRALWGGQRYGRDRICLPLERLEEAAAHQLYPDRPYLEWDVNSIHLTHASSNQHTTLTRILPGSLLSTLENPCHITWSYHMTKQCINWQNIDHALKKGWQC